MYLSLNTGSSSLKFKLFDKELKVITEGLFKHHNSANFVFTQNLESGIQNIDILEADYTNAISFLFTKLQEYKILENPGELDFIVHRIVHGGEEFTEPIELTNENITKVEKYSELAPLHNPFALEKIKHIAATYPNLKQFAVFDTSFHLTNPKENFLYGLPYGYYENIKVRKYGFHGISHKFVTEQVLSSNVERPTSNLIICHLGSGSSVCAVKDGKSLATSFGFTPMENLITSTRVGEIDYDAVKFLKAKLNLSDIDIEHLLTKESGLLGISGYSNDMKQLLADYESNDRAKLAIDMYVNSVIDYIAPFYVLFGGCDYLVFTAGIGQGSDKIREMICEKLKILNIKLKIEANSGQIDVVKNLDLTDSDSKTQVWVIPTNEELQMVNEVLSSKS